jgi:hypothetical protein
MMTLPRQGRAVRGDGPTLGGTRPPTPGHPTARTHPDGYRPWLLFIAAQGPSGSPVNPLISDQRFIPGQTEGQLSR